MKGLRLAGTHLIIIIALAFLVTAKKALFLNKTQSMGAKILFVGAEEATQCHPGIGPLGPC